VVADDHESVRFRIDMSTAEAVELTTRLAEDDEFRERFQADPRAVLFEYGIEASTEMIPPSVELPSKEEIAQMNQELGAGNFAAVQIGPHRLFPVWMFVFSFRMHSGESES
jgi:putative modified peptide